MPPRSSRAMTMDVAADASARNAVRSLKDRMASFQDGSKTGVDVDISSSVSSNTSGGQPDHIHSIETGGGSDEAAPATSSPERVGSTAFPVEAAPHQDVTEPKVDDVSLPHRTF